MIYKLCDLAQIKYGKNQSKVIDVNGKYPIFGTGGLMGYSKDYLYDKPSVLIGRKGTIDKVKYIDCPFWTVDTLFYTIINEKIIFPKYLYYLLQNVDLLKLNEGTTIPSLRTETLNRLEFDVPDKGIQLKTIALINGIDEKIAKNNEINDNLLNQAITIFNSFIDGKEKNGCIGDYCTVKSGFAFKSNWWTESGVKVIKIGSINQDELDLNSCSFVGKDKVEKAKEFCVVGGDLLIAMTGATIGKFTMVPSINEPILVNQRVGKFFLGRKPIERLPYIYCTLKQPDVFSEVINRGQGSAQPNISGGDIMSIPCVILNNDLINDFNKKTQPLFNMLIDNQKENKELSELRDTLLPKLMSGEIDVSNIKLDL